MGPVVKQIEESKARIVALETQLSGERAVLNGLRSELRAMGYSGICELPNTVALAWLQLVPQEQYGMVASTCCMFAQLVRDPSLYQTLELTNRDEDLEPLFALLNGQRFARVRELRLMGLNNVSTAAMNRVKYRAGLTVPAFGHLQALFIKKCGRGVGSLALARHLIGILPSTLIALSLGETVSGWTSVLGIKEIAKRCPKLRALDLGWQRASDQWLAVLEAVAECMSSLQMLDITYAGYGANQTNLATHQDYVQLLKPLAKLKKLTWIGLGCLGLAGVEGLRSATWTGDTGDLLSFVGELPQLRMVRTNFSPEFETQLHSRYPQVRVKRYLIPNEFDRYAWAEYAS